MRVYSVHVRRHGLEPDRDITLIKEGFCWPAFLFASLWALWHRLWLPAVVLFAVPLVLGAVTQGLGANPPAQAALSLGWSVIVGLLANDLHRRGLEGRGYVETGVSAGRNVDTALYAYLSDQPDAAADAVT